MATYTDGGILRAEHDLIYEALCEWILDTDASKTEGLAYINGVVDFANKLLNKDDDGQSK